MRILSLALTGLVFLACTTAYVEDPVEDVAGQILALERAALERWGNGDPGGYLELTAEEYTYFDPTLEKRIDGLKAITEYYKPIRGLIHVDRFEFVNPNVQVHGDVAVLTFNLIDYAKQADGSNYASSRWNSTEVYAKIDGEWKLIHSHWSFTKPELK